MTLKVGNPYVNDYSSEVKSMKYDNFMPDHGRAEPYSPRILENDERANQPPGGVTAFYPKYARNIRFPLHSFVAEVLQYYSIAFYQIHPFGY
ncbi:hypothetical protein Tco_0675925 [Tanacetum coccineum]